MDRTSILSLRMAASFIELVLDEAEGEQRQWLMTLHNDCIRATESVQA